jgi:nitroimidazol reductase NimA-like FMN-containing flavoprotein (pyridoxamine 5'-phosphate oxidase superfamily)
MDNVEFVYTVGMDEEELFEFLRENVAGTLSLAREGVAYGVPASYHYDEAEDRLLVRLVEDGDGWTLGFLGGTDEASFLLHDVEDREGHSRSVMIRGSLRPLPDHAFDDAALNDLFDPVRVFDEEISEVRVHVLELVPTEVTGRKTAPGQ